MRAFLHCQSSLEQVLLEDVSRACHDKPQSTKLYDTPPSPSKLFSLSLYIDFYARSILWRKMYFWLVTSAKQRKNSESPWGIKPQTFGFHNLMLYHWATETLSWARPIVKSYLFIYKIIQIVRTLWLAIKPFYMSLCKKINMVFVPLSLVIL